MSFTLLGMSLKGMSVFSRKRAYISKSHEKYLPSKTGNADHLLLVVTKKKNNNNKLRIVKNLNYRKGNCMA